MLDLDFISHRARWIFVALRARYFLLQVEYVLQLKSDVIRLLAHHHDGHTLLGPTMTYVHVMLNYRTHDIPAPYYKFIQGAMIQFTM
jgi:hypothetical protein